MTKRGWLLLLPPGKHNLPLKRNTRRAGNIENDSLIWVVPPWRVIPNQLASSKVNSLYRVHFHSRADACLRSVSLRASLMYGRLRQKPRGKAQEISFPATNL